KLAVTDKNLVRLTRFELLSGDAGDFDSVFENRAGTGDSARIDDVESALREEHGALLTDGDEFRRAGLLFKKVEGFSDEARVVGAGETTLGGDEYEADIFARSL